MLNCGIFSGQNETKRWSASPKVLENKRMNLHPLEWCSSYMHFERTGAIAAVRTCNFTNKASQEKPNQKSSNDGILLPHSSNCVCECGQYISSEGEYFECLGEQEGSTPARVAIFGFSGQIDGVYGDSTFGKDHLHLNTEDSAIEIELHLYFKRHFQKCPAVIENASMKGQSQPMDIMDSSNLMEEEVRVCDICGDVGLEELLAMCNKCTDGAEHIYCMGIKLDKVPEGDWTCQKCILRTDAKKSEQDKVKETTGKSVEREQMM